MRLSAFSEQSRIGFRASSPLHLDRSVPVRNVLPRKGKQYDGRSEVPGNNVPRVVHVDLDEDMWE
jgi:hypothetical protein